jgi:hypothetical protein
MALVAFAALCLQGCFIGSLIGHASKGRRVRNTDILANDANWTKLETAAREIGWVPVRSTAVADWDLRVTLAASQGELQMDGDPDTGTISYVCDKGPVKDENRCFDAMNQLVGRAFNVQLQKK